MWGTPTSWATNTWTNTPALTTPSLAGYSIAIGAGATIGSTDPLVPGTLYYYRPFVTNLGPAGDNVGYFGITYLSVTTLAVVQLPEIGVGGITYSSSTKTLSVIGTTIINTGGAAIISSGLCYKAGGSTPPDTNSAKEPNTNNNLTSFTTNINFPDTGVYLIRAYVTNAGGTSYSTKTIVLNTIGSVSINFAP